MKSTNWKLLGIAPLMICAACTHSKVPFAGQTNPRVPVSVPTATVAPAPAGTKVAAVPARVQQSAAGPATSQRSALLTPQDRQTLNQRLARLEDALFDYNKTTIRDDARNALRDDVTVIRDILANYPAQKLLIEGHADQRGSAEYNLALGDRRARAAEDFLASMGIAKDQLHVLSYGEERPACTDLTEACWQKNRRAHITAAP
jgi:peptidoglycan-associated lipoprotein